MIDSDEQGVVRPEVVLLETLLDDIAAGRLRVPRFQRPFVWEPHQMLELFDSIERGYPIGSILIWETTTEVPSLDTVAGIDIPPPPTDRTVSYLLDGHQRLSTLFGTLVKRPAPVGPDDWQWHIFRQLGESGDTRRLRFQHTSQARNGDAPAEGHLLPLQALLRTMDFLAYARAVTRNPKITGEADVLIDEAERLAQRIKSYKIAVIRLVGGDLTHAVEAFTRLNSGGRRIEPHEFVSALTYRTNDESLTDRIDTLRHNIAASGFGTVDSRLLFRTFLQIGGGPQAAGLTRWQEIATLLEGRLDEIAERTNLALARVVQFLRYEAGVPHCLLLPDGGQLVSLATAYDRTPEPSRETTESLVRWFWLTSWTGEMWLPFGKRHESIIAEMSTPSFASARADRAVAPPIQPLPDRFSRDSPRVRAYLLWELREFGRRLDLDGSVIDAVDLYVRSGHAAYRRIMDSGSDSPANHLLLPGAKSVSLVQDLVDLPPRTLREVVTSHGIPISALTRLLAGDAEGFVNERRAFLAASERAFMHSMGVKVPPIHPSGVDYEA